MWRFMRWAGERRGRPFADYDELWRWSVDRARGLLGEHLGVLRRARVASRRAGAGLPHDARRELVRGRRAELRREHALGLGASRRAGPGGGGGAAHLRAARARSAELGRALRAGGRRGRRDCARSACGRGDRVVAYMPNIPETLIAFLAVGLDRGDLVERRARVRRAQRDRPLRPDRAQGAARRRRLPPRRQGLRPERAPCRASSPSCRRVEHVVALPYLHAGSTRGRSAGATPRTGGRRRIEPARAPRLAGAAASAARAPSCDFEQVPFDAPAVGALLLRHHRSAEGDRAEPRRHPRRAAEEEPAPRSAPGGPHVLVHHDRLDDVELPRSAACSARPRSSSTTAVPATPTWASCGSSPSAPASPAWASARACWRAVRRPASSPAATTI